MNLIFFGSSTFSLAALEACCRPPQKVLLIITTPDQKKGRGLKETPTPVRLFAEQHKIPVVAPENLKSPELIEKIKALDPELFVVSSYGKMIPTAWLKIPSKVALNVHPSLLPKYRGAAPIQWPILKGDHETGISIAEVTAKLDAGDIFFQKRIPLGPDITAEKLSENLANLSAQALETVFEKILYNALAGIPQQDSLSTYARKLAKEDGWIDWKQSAEKISNQVRGLLPWPIATTFWEGEPVQILKAHFENVSPSAVKPGEIMRIDKDGWICVRCGSGALILERLRPAGKKEMSAGDFARGRRLASGMRLG